MNLMAIPCATTRDPARVLATPTALALFDLTSPWPWAGWVVTGILIGRGSNFVHDFASRWLAKPPYG